LGPQPARIGTPSRMHLEQAVEGAPRLVGLACPVAVICPSIKIRTK